MKKRKRARRYSYLHCVVAVGRSGRQSEIACTHSPIEARGLRREAAAAHRARHGAGTGRRYFVRRKRAG